MLDHPGELNHSFELQLAPPAADLRCAEGIDQRLRLVLQLLGTGAHGVDLLPQPDVGALALLLDVPQLALDPLQRCRHRVEQCADRPVAHRGVARQRGGRLLDPALRQRDELLVVRRQRVRREGTEGPRELLVPAGEQLLSAGRALAFGAQRGGGRRRLRLGPAQLRQRLVVRGAQIGQALQEARALGPDGGGVGAQRDRRVGRGPGGVRGRRAEPQAQQHPARAGTDEHPGEQEQGGNGVHARRVPVRTDRTGRGTPGGTVNGTGESPNGRTCGRRGAPRDCSKVALLQSDWSRATLLQSARPPGRQRCASWSSNHRFTGSPQRNPPSDPSLRSTRWHGTNSAAALRAHADAAARTAAGRPAFAAYSV